jgi:hypothetical protein
MPSVRERWLSLVRSYSVAQQRPPVAILATGEDEREWAALPASEAGEALASRIVEAGVREALPRFLAIPIIWDQPKTVVI